MKKGIITLVLNLVAAVALTNGCGHYAEYLGNDFQVGFHIGLNIYLLISLMRAGWVYHKDSMELMDDRLNALIMARDNIIVNRALQEKLDEILGGSAIKNVIIHDLQRDVKSLQEEVNELRDEPKYETDYKIDEIEVVSLEEVLADIIIKG